MEIQPRFDSPLAAHFDDIEPAGAADNAKRHAVMAFVSSRDDFINGLDPYEYMDIDSGYGVLRASQVDTAAEIIRFDEDEQSAASDAGFAIDITIEDYAYDNGYDEPELMIAEMARGMHKDVWKPIVPVVEAAYELDKAFGIKTQYTDFDKYPQLGDMLSRTGAYDKVPSLSEYYGPRSNVDNYTFEELVVSVAATESKLLGHDANMSSSQLFSDEELKCLHVTEDFGKGFSRDGESSFKAHFDELYRDAFLGDGEVSAKDVVHLSSLQEEIRSVSPHEIDTLTMLEQMSPDIRRDTPHFLLDALEPSTSSRQELDASTREMYMSALNDENNLIVDYEHGIAMMSDIEDQSVRGYLLDKQDLFDVVKQVPNNMRCRDAFCGPIADRAQSSFSTWDVGFSMIMDKFAEQGMTHMVYADTPSDLRHKLNKAMSNPDLQQYFETNVSPGQPYDSFGAGGDVRVKTDIGMIDHTQDVEFSHEAEA